MNKTSIPPKNTINKIYENQNVFLNNPVIMEINNVWVRSINPIASGWDIKIKIKDVKILKIVIIK